MKLTEKAFTELKEHCLSSRDEVCGFCLGENGTAMGIRRARNAAPAHMRAGLFILAPEDMLWLAKRRISGEPVLAVYHSHPVIAADASVIDIAGLHFGDITYLIYSVRDDELKAWRRKNSTLVEEKVEVIE